jgi:signal transduction histidine kinase
MALVLIYLAITKIIVRPLSRITDAVSDAAQGNLETTVPIEGSGEIIQLGVTLNRMIATIKNQQNELKQQIKKIEQSNKELKATQAQLVQTAKLASIGTLAAGVAHEIGNPIAGILALVELLEHETDKNTIHEYQKLIAKEIKRIDSTIRDLLTFANPSRPLMQNDEKTDINEVWHHVLTLIKAQKLFDKIDIKASIPKEVNKISMDSKSLAQILINLLLNAGQAINGTGTIKIRAQNLTNKILPFESSPVKAVEISIEDSGPGILEEDAEKLFLPFFSKKTSGRGSGLGLSICQNICSQSKAEIKLDTTFKSGARFIITIPV